MLSLLSVLLSLLDKVFGYVSDTEKAKIQAQASVDVATIQGTAAVEQRWWFVSALLPAFALPYVAYYAKVVFWDNVWNNGHTSTPALHGSADTIGWIIVTGLFLHSLSKR